MRVSVLSAVLQGHTAPLRAAVFSPDGQRVLTASNDRTARIWDARTGQPVAVLQGHTASVSAAVFSPDGARVLTTSDNGTARIWRVFLTTRALVDEAKQKVPRCLTQGQRERAFLEPEPLPWCIELGKWPYATAEWKEWLRYKRANASPLLPDTPEWTSWREARREQ
jgi:dipeptidyl aminopeptidase/acylaminoacyl peptidase